MPNTAAGTALPRWERAALQSPLFRRIERRASDLAERTADGARAARRRARRLANDAVDARDSAAVYVRRHPLQSVLVMSGIMLTTGAIAGFVLGRRGRH